MARSKKQQVEQKPKINFDWCAVENKEIVISLWGQAVGSPDQGKEFILEFDGDHSSADDLIAAIQQWKEENPEDE